MYLRQRHLTRTLAFNRLENVSGLQPGLVGGTVRQHRNYSRVAKAFGDGCADPTLSLGMMLFKLLVFSRGQIAGIGIERFQQSVERAHCNRLKVRLLHIFGANPLQDFGINAELAVGAVAA